MKTKVFPLSHFVLYAKGWYKHSDDIWEDLKKILELDDYTSFTKNDVYSILASRFDEFDCRQSELRQVLFGIHPNECWKTGYYTKNCIWVNNSDTLPEYDMPTAFIYYMMSTFRFIENDKWKPVIPKYKKFPKGENITLPKVYEIFVKPKMKELC